VPPVCCSLTAAAEICAGAKFDWVLIDMEHAPNDLSQVRQQLQDTAAYPATSVVVRSPWNDSVMLKRLLDLGAQSILIPYVQNEEEARAAVRAVRYPPQGLRGVSTSSRANQFGRLTSYFQKANDQICLLIQVETKAALSRIEQIAAIDGVDGLFIGPQDLAADMGHIGNPNHPEVQAAIRDGIRRIKATGKAPGLLCFQEADAHRWLKEGVCFLAITSDQFILARETSALAARFCKL